jgi:hypothetical protein
MDFLKISTSSHKLLAAETHLAEEHFWLIAVNNSIQFNLLKLMFINVPSVQSTTRWLIMEKAHQTNTQKDNNQGA